MRKSEKRELKNMVALWVAQGFEYFVDEVNKDGEDRFNRDNLADTNVMLGCLDELTKYGSKLDQFIHAKDQDDWWSRNTDTMSDWYHHHAAQEYFEKHYSQYKTK